MRGRVVQYTEVLHQTGKTIYNAVIVSQEIVPAGLVSAAGGQTPPIVVTSEFKVSSAKPLEFGLKDEVDICFTKVGAVKE